MDSILTFTLASVVAVILIVGSFMLVRYENKMQPNVFSNGSILLKTEVSGKEFLNRELGMRRRSRKSK